VIAVEERVLSAVRRSVVTLGQRKG
jgi:hypothetical protein